MKSLSRGLSAFALVAWGGLLLYFFLSGRLNEYLIPAYRPLAAISGVVMIGIAVSLWISQYLDSRSGRRATVGLEGLATRRVRLTQAASFALLVVPLWAAGGLSNDSYGARAILNRGITTDASHLPGKAATLPAAPSVYEPPLPGETPGAVDPAASADPTQYLKKSAGGHIIAEVTDLLFAADDDTMRPAFDGKTVEMIGQYMPAKDSNNVSGQRFQLVRMFMVCCAADARPVAVQIEPAAAPKLPEMAWTKVVGKVTFPMEDGRRQAVIRCDSATPTEPPGETMLY